MHLHTHFKDQVKNFGVLEIILSVAILAAFSVYVLQLFVTASSDEKKMVQLDEATYNAVSIVEQFKNSESPFGIKQKYGGSETSGFYSRTVSISDGLTVDIKITKSGTNSAGVIYNIDVNIKNSGGNSIYSLSGNKFFSGAT